MIDAAFTAEQVDALNAYQRDGIEPPCDHDWFMPSDYYGYNCPQRSSMRLGLKSVYNIGWKMSPVKCPAIGFRCRAPCLVQCVETPRQCVNRLDRIEGIFDVAASDRFDKGLALLRSRH